MKLSEAKKICTKLGMVLTKTDDEYRVAYRKDSGFTKAEREASAHYTNDLDDAIGTAQHMSRMFYSARRFQ